MTTSFDNRAPVPCLALHTDDIVYDVGPHPTARTPPLITKPVTLEELKENQFWRAHVKKCSILVLPWPTYASNTVAGLRGRVVGWGQDCAIVKPDVGGARRHVDLARRVLVYSQ
jgi:hypothetical protein